MNSFWRNEADEFYKKGNERKGKVMTNSAACNAIVSFGDYRSRLQLNNKLGGSWLYVGRGVWDEGIGRSPLANPFTSNANAKSAVLVATKAEAIAAFRVHLFHQIKTGNEPILDELRAINPRTVLVCHCKKPALCHATVISRAADWVRREGK